VIGADAKATAARCESTAVGAVWVASKSTGLKGTNDFKPRINVKGPPQWGQCSISPILNTRLSHRAQLRRAGAAGGGSSPGSAEGGWALSGTLGMISGRSLALRPRRGLGSE